MIAYLYFFNHYSVVVASMGFYLFNCKNSLTRYATITLPASILVFMTSQIRFADDNFTYMDCNGMLFKDALGLTAGDYPESCN